MKLVLLLLSTVNPVLLFPTPVRSRLPVL